MNKDKMQRNLNIMKGNLLFNLITHMIGFGFSIYLSITMINNARLYPELKDIEYGSFVILLMAFLTIIVGLVTLSLLLAFITLIKRNFEKFFFIKLASFFLIFTPISYFAISGFIGFGLEMPIITIPFTILGLIISIYSLIFMFRPKSDDIKTLFTEDVAEVDPNIKKISNQGKTSEQGIQNKTESKMTIQLYTNKDFEKVIKQNFVGNMIQFFVGILMMAIVMIFGPKDGELTGNIFMTGLFIVGAYLSVLKWVLKLFNASPDDNFVKSASKEESWFKETTCQHCQNKESVNLGYNLVECPECTISSVFRAPLIPKSKYQGSTNENEKGTAGFTLRMINGENTCPTCKKPIEVENKKVWYECSACEKENLISNAEFIALAKKVKSE